MMLHHQPQPAHEHLSTMTASLAISSPVLSRPPPPSSVFSRPQRPRLTLNTTQAARNFGGKNSSLRLETLSAISPTVRNTFTNGHEQSQGPLSAGGTGRSSRLRLMIDSSVSTKAPVKSETEEAKADAHTLDSASTPSTSTTTTSTSSVESSIIQIPYKLAHNVKSILSNSPLPKRTPISSFAMSRPMFPQQKRVSFRAPLEEEIKTSKYTMAHSDINSLESDSTRSSQELSIDSSTSSEGSDQLSLELPESASFAPSSSDETSSSPTHSDTPSLSLSTSSTASASSTSEDKARPRASRVARHPKIGDKRDSSSESDSDSCPETPVAGRRKKKRVWVWTLDPLDNSTPTTTSTDEDHSDS